MAARRQKNVRRIALMLSADLASNRAILRGLNAFVEERQLQWVSRVGPARAGTLQELVAWKPDGIIAKIYDEPTARAVTGLRIPLVNTTNLVRLALPLVAVDDVAVGRMAARHLLERGFRHFAYVGFAQQQSPRSRQTAYIDELKQRGFAVHGYTHFDLLPFRRGETWGAVDPRFRKWLLSVPKPIAVFAYHDFLAWEVMQACYTLKLEVPEQLALLGVDDDELFCRLAQPPMSSIAYPADRIGYEAAAMLERIMRAKRAPRAPVLIAPSGVVVRESTDIVANGDEDLARAMRYIRENLAQPISVRSILRDVPTSRRTLEEKFRRALGRSPLQEIRRVRIERAQHFLARTRMRVYEIAKHCGFSTPERFAAVFRGSTGLTPREYRDGHGARAPERQ